MQTQTKARDKRSKNNLTPCQEITGMTARDRMFQYLRFNSLKDTCKRSREFERVQRRADRAFALFAILASTLKLELQNPGFESLSSFSKTWEAEMVRVIYQWCDALMGQLKYDSIGTWDYIGEKEVIYTFFEDVDVESSAVRREFEIKKKRVKNTHTVVDADLRHIPCHDVQLDAKAKWMIEEILRVKDLAPYFGIITGTLVETEEQITKRWEEETELKKALRVIRKSVGYKVEEVENEINDFNSKVEEGSFRQFLRKPDPAIVFGNDVVFYGWK